MRKRWKVGDIIEFKDIKFHYIIKILHINERDYEYTLLYGNNHYAPNTFQFGSRVDIESKKISREKAMLELL